VGKLSQLSRFPDSLAMKYVIAITDKDFRIRAS
jgi:hypothetical protein